MARPSLRQTGVSHGVVARVVRACSLHVDVWHAVVAAMPVAVSSAGGAACDQVGRVAGGWPGTLAEDGRGAGGGVGVGFGCEGFVEDFGTPWCSSAFVR
jgi:hypothetical protein